MTIQTYCLCSVSVKNIVFSVPTDSIYSEIFMLYIKPGFSDDTMYYLLVYQFREGRLICTINIKIISAICMCYMLSDFRFIFIKEFGSRHIIPSLRSFI